MTTRRPWLSRSTSVRPSSHPPPTSLHLPPTPSRPHTDASTPDARLSYYYRAFSEPHNGLAHLFHLTDFLYGDPNGSDGSNDRPPPTHAFHTTTIYTHTHTSPARGIPGKNKLNLMRDSTTFVKLQGLL